MFAFVRSENERLAKQSGERQTTVAAEQPSYDAGDPVRAVTERHERRWPPRFQDSSTSVTLHRFGTDPAYENWRFELLGLGRFRGASSDFG